MASNLPGLENILDNLDVGIIIFDNKGTYLFVNKTLLQYTGRTRQDYLNHTHDFPPELHIQGMTMQFLCKCSLRNPCISMCSSNCACATHYNCG